MKFITQAVRKRTNIEVGGPNDPKSDWERVACVEFKLAQEI